MPCLGDLLPFARLGPQKPEGRLLDYGPLYASGAPDPSGPCREDWVTSSRDIRSLLSWTPTEKEIAKFPPGAQRIKKTDTSGGGKAKYLLEICPSRTCEEAIFDRGSSTWYCSKFGAPCSAGCPAPKALFTWTESYGGGLEKVPADESGNPLFAPYAPEQKTSTSSVMLWGGAALAALLLFTRR